MVGLLGFVHVVEGPGVNGRFGFECCGPYCQRKARKGRRVVRVVIEKLCSWGVSCRWKEKKRWNLGGRMGLWMTCKPSCPKRTKQVSPSPLCQI